VVAGLSIIFKQIQALLQILQFVFLGMTFVPLSALPWLELAPFVKGVDLTRQVMTQGLGLGDLGPLDWLSLIANAAFYFSLGLAFFRWCEQVARRQGLLGQY
jgi:ABC-2 type transport system permease protein